MTFRNWGSHTPIETTELELNELQNNLAIQGWEYFDTMTIGTYGFAMIIFKRERNNSQLNVSLDGDDGVWD